MDRPLVLVAADVSDVLGGMVDLTPVVAHEVKAQPIVGQLLAAAERTDEVSTVVRSPRRTRLLFVRSRFVVFYGMNSHISAQITVI